MPGHDPGPVRECSSTLQIPAEPAKRTLLGPARQPALLVYRQACVDAGTLGTQAGPPGSSPRPMALPQPCPCLRGCAGLRACSDPWAAVAAAPGSGRDSSLCPSHSERWDLHGLPKRGHRPRAMGRLSHSSPLREENRAGDTCSEGAQRVFLNSRPVTRAACTHALVCSEPGRGGDREDIQMFLVSAGRTQHVASSTCAPLRPPEPQRCWSWSTDPGKPGLRSLEMCQGRRKAADTEWVSPSAGTQRR